MPTTSRLAQVRTASVAVLALALMLGPTSAEALCNSITLVRFVYYDNQLCNGDPHEWSWYVTKNAFNCDTLESGCQASWSQIEDYTAWTWVPDCQLPDGPPPINFCQHQRTPKRQCTAGVAPGSKTRMR